MAVVKTVSTNGRYKVFSSANAALVTAISDVIDELENHHIAFNQIQFTLTFDDTGQEYIYIATCRSG